MLGKLVTVVVLAIVVVLASASAAYLRSIGNAATNVAGSTIS